MTGPTPSHSPVEAEQGEQSGLWLAWTDLHERITDGLRNLWDLKADYTAKGNREQVDRLDGKVNGVLIGQHLYQQIQHEFIDAPEHDTEWATAYETAWLTLTARLYAAAQASTDPLVRQGLLLVNRWQTGYGHDIDAPQIVPA